MKLRCCMEMKWYDAMRPYYKVWPSVIKPLCRTKLDVPMNAMSIRERSIVARFANGCEVATGDMLLRAILIYATTEGLSLLCDGLDTKSGLETTSIPLQFPLLSDKTFEQHIADAPQPPQLFVRDEFRETLGFGDVALRIALSLLLLADDPSIIEPDVLSKDERKYEQTKDQKFIKKAHRRGKVGWHIGKTFDAMPHYRRPHLALRHTGKGRMIPQIVPVKGSVVHRQKMTTVPTGYITPEGVEVENVQ